MGVLGIDCGKSGALAFYDGHHVRFWQMPLKDGEIDIQELNKLTFMIPLDCIVIEEQNTFASDGRYGVFTMGINYGRLLAWAEQRCSQLCRVRPQVWQKAHGIALKHDKGTTNTQRKQATKAAALERLKSLNPLLADQTTGPRGGNRDGLVDSILIAMWGHNELRRSYWPSRSGIGCFADAGLSSTPKGAKGGQRSKRSGGKR